MISRSNTRTCSRPLSLLLINKIDLLPYVEFDLNHCQDYARQVNPAIEIMTLSPRREKGLKIGLIGFGPIAPGALGNVPQPWRPC